MLTTWRLKLSGSNSATRQKQQVKRLSETNKLHAVRHFACACRYTDGLFGKDVSNGRRSLFQLTWLFSLLDVRLRARA